jgi:hypothetical protein
MVFVVLAFAAWLAWRTVGYIIGNGVIRFHVESAALSFIAAAVVARVIRAARTTAASGPLTAVPWVPRWTLVLWWLSAAALYWPALWIGFLSDDFGLAERAAQWQLGLVSPQLFRPVPLALWGLVLHAGGGALAIHLLNILLHGTNAYLTTRIIESYVRHRPTVIFAGVFVVAFPLGTEAVAWASGVFDVMSTTWMLAGVLVARGFGSRPSIRRRLALYTCGAAALLSKETAVIMPLVLALDMWATGRRSRRLLQDAGSLLAIDVSVIAIRVIMAPQVMNQAVTKFMIQRWVFETFGSPAFPWHSSVIQGMRGGVLLEALAVISLLTVYALRTEAIGTTRVALAMASWMLVSTLPVITTFGVAPDLQGARYLYMAGIGWAGLLACLASADGFTRASGVQIVGLAIIALTYVAGVSSHLTPWRRAADLRDRVERAAADDPRMAACKIVQVSNLPDNIDGAYVLRTSGRAAFARDLGMQISSDAVGGCSFSWDQKQGGFVPVVQ